MREPTLCSKPFSQCSNDELRDNILPAEREVVSYDSSGVSLQLAIEVSLAYASILISERIG